MISRRSLFGLALAPLVPIAPTPPPFKFLPVGTVYQQCMAFSIAAQTNPEASMAYLKRRMAERIRRPYAELGKALDAAMPPNK